jgi:hypothetical protein
LHLKSSIRINALYKVSELAEEGKLTCRRELEIPGNSSDQEERSTIGQAVARLLLALRSLSVLSAKSMSKDALDVLSERHGPVLQRLETGDYICTLEDLRQLRDLCPYIVELNIEILQTCGDEERVTKYQTVGGMPKLKKLTLHVRCIGLRPTRPHAPVTSMGHPSSPDEMEALVVELRRILIDSATDEKLARAIFDTICAARNSPSLSTLTLRPSCAHIVQNHIIYQDFQNVVRWIGHDWSIRCDPRDTHREEVTVKESEGQHVSDRRSIQERQ